MKNTTSITPASLGSISHGTLRTEDLLAAFLHELEWNIRRNGDFFSNPENFALRDKLNSLIGDAQDCFDEDGENISDEEKQQIALDMVSIEFPDILTEYFAPPYCSFGAHEGDGSDFGYWPNWGEIDDLPQVSDNSDEAITAEQSDDYRTDVRYVNDHGNTTIYGADGSVLLELV